ncbi:MAG TPA: hypothetical protein IAC47_04695, partial [Candidatus Onthomorpha intestinigallinarum]|nr:hypothetical protein [Candidatus Onthomorpha intestinigallinarum]
LKNSHEDPVEAVGASFRPLSKLEQATYQLSKGIVIERTGKSPFARLGIKSGFIITSIDRNPNVTMEQIKQLDKRKGKVIIEGFYPQDSRTYYFVLVL